VSDTDDDAVEDTPQTPLEDVPDEPPTEAEDIITVAYSFKDMDRLRKATR